MMRVTRYPLGAGLLAVAAASGAADTEVAAANPAQLPAISGEVQQLTLTARGDIDGFLLKDGTEVKTPPPLSLQIANSVKPNDRVIVHGLRAAALPLVRAASVVDEDSHRTFTDADAGGAAAPPVSPMPPAAPAGVPDPRPGPATQRQGPASEMRGRVRLALHGPQGEVNGVLLEDGTMWRFPPERAGELTALLQPHQTLVAEGIPVGTRWGTVVDVQQIGSSGDRLISVGLPSGPRRGPGGPPPPDGGAPPAPPR